MTVTYTAQVASCKRFGCFWKLLFRWKGSIYKLLWPNIIVYSMMYSALSICYRFFLDENQKTTFEKLSLHCQTYGDLIPVSFVLGFYVSIVVKRWWDQYMSIPWPDPLAVFISAFISGQDERSRLMRRTIMRYANLSLALALQMMCPTVKKRFPTLEHFVNAGFLLPNERKIFEKLEEKTLHPKYWLPLVWSTSIINTARREERIKDDFGFKTLVDEVNKFRGGCGSLLNYDWISVPLVYTQVVTLAVYTYFLAALMGNQYLNPKKGYPKHTIDLIVPIFTLLQFFFYMGWLLVAETLVNPFGEDDDDFEVNWLIDRNLQISYLIVDEVHEEYPELVRDKYWEEVFPTELPYTEATKQFYTEPFLGSTKDVDVPMDQQGIILMSMLTETDLQLKSMSPKDLIRKETIPVQILSKAIPKSEILQENEASNGETRESFSCSVIKMLKKKIYGDGSKKSLTNSGFFQRRNDNKSRFNSQAYSVASTYLKTFTDFSEDIFHMSDLSLVEPHSYILPSPEFDRINPKDRQVPLREVFSLSENSRLLSGQKLIPPDQIKPFRSTPHIPALMRKGLYESQGQGEQIEGQNYGFPSICSLPNFLNSPMNAIDGGLVRFDFGSSCTSTSLARNSAKNYAQLPGNTVELTVPECQTQKNEFSDHVVTQENHFLIQHAGEEIIPLHQQILLQPPLELPTGTDTKDNCTVLENLSTATEQSNVMENLELKELNSSVPLIENKNTSILGILQKSDSNNFEKPTPTPAIIIPGCILGTDHLNLPVIEDSIKQSPVKIVKVSPEFETIPAPLLPSGEIIKHTIAESEGILKDNNSNQMYKSKEDSKC